MRSAAELEHIIIRPAQADDAAALAVFAASAFVDTYAAGNDADDMELYVRQHFSPTVQLSEIEDPESAVILAVSGSSFAAYAHLRCEEKACQLKRLYVDAGWKGSGLAQGLLNEVRNRCGSAGKQSIWLTVWERNARAIAFYTKSGFVVEGDVTFVVGRDRQRDLRMRLSLPVHPHAIRGTLHPSGKPALR